MKDRRLIPVRGKAWLVLALAVLVAMVTPAAESTACDPQGVGCEAHEPPPPIQLPPYPIDPILPSAPVGYLPASTSVTSTGEFTISVPLDVPPGRAGVQPSLALKYSSRGQNGMMGLGWSIAGGHSEIKRCGKTLASDGAVDGVDFDDDRFCIDSRKLTVVNGVYGAHLSEYRTENDTFAKVISFGSGGEPDSFKVWAKNGQILEYEAVNAKRVVPDLANPYTLNPVAVLTPLWVLKEVRDRSGNYMRYSYHVDAQAAAPFALEVYLEHIEYTFSDLGDPARRKVEFVYENRPDPSFRYESGVRFSTTQRLTGVEMYAPNPSAMGATELVWRYELAYEAPPPICIDPPCTPKPPWRSYLASVKRCDAEDVCLWAKEFAWKHAYRPSFDVFDSYAVEFPPETFNTQGGFGFVVLDADGDGRDDLAYKTDPDHAYLRRTTGAEPLGTRTETTATTPILSEWSPYVSRTVDVDADAATELYGPVGLGTNPWYHVFRYNQATSSFDDLGQHEPAVYANGFVHTVDFTDLNGDRILDLVRRKFNPTQEWAWRMGSTSGFGPPQVGPLNLSTCSGVKAADLDGDGRGDLLLSGSCATTVKVSLDDAGAFVTQNASADDGLKFLLADINGDGLKDAVYPDNGTPVVRYNTGTGFGPYESLVEGPYPESLPFPGGEDDGMRVADVNGDGRDDVVTFNYDPTPDIRVYLAQDSSLSPLKFQELPLGLEPGELAYHGWTFSQLGDFNGDGLIDIVQVVDDHIRVLQQQPDVGDVIDEVWDELSLNARDLVLYSTAWSDSPEASTCTYPARCIRRGFTVARQHKVSQGEAVQYYRTTLYDWQDPRSDAHGRGFLGFGRMRECDPDLPSEKITEFDHTTRSGTVYPNAMVPAKVTSILPIVEQWADVPWQQPWGPDQRARVREVTWRYALLEPVAGKTFAVVPGAWDSAEWEEDVHIHPDHIELLESPGAPVLRRRQGSYAVDNYGNVTTVTVATTSGVTRQVLSTYDNFESDWLIGLLRTRTTSSHDPTVLPVPEPRLVTFAYHAGTGLLKQIVVEPNHPELRRTMTYLRSTWGLIDQVADGAQGEPVRWTYFAHDDEGVFPTQTYNDLLQYHLVHFHPAFGVAQLVADPNGVKEERRLDGFGRLVQSDPQGGENVDVSYSADDREDPGFPRGVAVSVARAGGGASVTFHDELDRPWELLFDGFDGQPLSRQRRFNGFGSVIREHRPAPPASAPGPGGILVWDSLNRPVNVFEPDGTHTDYQQSMFETHIEDAEHHKKWFRRDVDNRISKSVGVFLHPNLLEEDVATEYHYGPFDLLERVVDGSGEQTFIDRDKLGRPSVVDDPNMGIRTLAWNGFGELRHEIDQLQTTAYEYDVLGRMEQKLDDEGATTFVWDTSANGLGKLASTLSADGTTTEYGYDTDGRPVLTKWNVGGPMYKIETEYDQQHGRVSKILYPEAPGRPRFTIEHTYNGSGYLEHVKDVSNPADPVEIWSVLSRNADLALGDTEFGNGVQASRAYDPTMGRLTDISTSGGQGAYAMTYGYDDIGNVLTRSDAITGRVEAFEYDTLNRMTDWTVTHASQSRHAEYEYDDVGNLLRTWVNTVLEEDNQYGCNNRPYVLQSNLTSPPFSCDDLGRQTQGYGRTIVYTPFHLPRSIVTAQGTTSLSYDALGQRVKKSGPNGDVVTLAGLYERRQAGAQIDHVFYVRGEGGLVAQLEYDEDASTEKLEFLQTDHLGSVGLVTDSSGGEVTRLFFDPFGKRVGLDGGPPPSVPADVLVGFTGHRHDDELGLIDMGGRVYDPTQRRFITPDPFIPDPLEGQSHNRYAYALNNPLRHVDPTGFSSIRVADVPSGEGPGSPPLTGKGSDAQNRSPAGSQSKDTQQPSENKSDSGGEDAAESSPEDEPRSGDPYDDAGEGADKGAPDDPSTGMSGDTLVPPPPEALPDGPGGGSTLNALDRAFLHSFGEGLVHIIPFGWDRDKSTGDNLLDWGLQAVVIGGAPFYAGPLAIAAIGDAAIETTGAAGADDQIDSASKAGAAAGKWTGVLLGAVGLKSIVPKGSPRINPRNVALIRRARGKGNDITVPTQREAEATLNEARPDIPWVETYARPKPRVGAEVHGSDGSGIDLPHIKWRDWRGGKSQGAEGHIYFEKP